MELKKSRLERTKIKIQKDNQNIVVNTIFKIGKVILDLKELFNNARKKD